MKPFYIFNGGLIMIEAILGLVIFGIVVTLYIDYQKWLMVSLASYAKAVSLNINIKTIRKIKENNDTPQKENCSLIVIDFLSSFASLQSLKSPQNLYKRKIPTPIGIIINQPISSIIISLH